MSDPRLDVFSPTLLRLILCGGDGLAPAYGPTVEHARGAGDRPAAWCGDRMVTIEGRHGASGRDRLDDLDPAAWSLPLDHWAPRLALVAAWLLNRWRDPSGDDGLPPAFTDARVRIENNYVLLDLWYAVPNEEGEIGDTWDWRSSTGMGGSGLRLPTLPALLADHAPVVALLLAIEEVSRA